MAKPATKLVRLFNRHRAMESLPRQEASVTEPRPVCGAQAGLFKPNTPVAVIAVLVVAPQRREDARANPEGVENLAAGVHPHLKDSLWVMVSPAVSGGPMVLSVVLLKACALLWRRHRVFYILQFAITQLVLQ